MTGIRIHPTNHRPPARLLAVALIAVAVIPTLKAQTPLQGKLAIRPLTRDEITNYKLPSTLQVSAGLTTVGLGEPVYLEAQVNVAIKASDILSVTWTLSNKPGGSNATLGTSPLTAAVPVFEPSDRQILQVAGRSLLVPDVVGPYVVTAHIATASAGSADVAQTIIGATYVGINACSACHSGGLADPKVPAWQKTAHATIFTSNMNGGDNGSYSVSCLGCHTVGYDATAGVKDGGFYQVAQQLNWQFPTTFAPGTYNTVPAALQNLANIQCENCHGPGSQHVIDGGSTLEISTSSTNTGTCSQCHAAATHHIKSAEWNNSMHAVTTRDPTGTGRDACVGCHTGAGFVARTRGVTTFSTDYSAIDCQTCHEPHGQTTPGTAPHLLRSLAAVKLADGTAVSDGGTGLLCMNCHQSRQNASIYAATTPGSAHFGPHEGPQADMLEGVNGFTYGEQIPTSAHAFAAADTCATCHMQTVAATDPSLTHEGGHTFLPSWTDSSGAKHELVGACQTCHGEDVTTFNFPLFDYNNDGKIEGVQTEVQHLLDQLSTLLPPDNSVKTSLAIDATWTQPQLEAAYNWQFVTNDGSHGIHNTAYAVGLLKASIDDLQARAAH